jgi:hypothetical protein
MAINPSDAENARLKQLLQQTSNEMTARAAPRIGELIDALNNLIRGAEMGNLQAKDALRQFFAALDNARGATSTLTVVRNGSPPPSPS